MKHKQVTGFHRQTNKAPTARQLRDAQTYKQTFFRQTNRASTVTHIVPLQNDKSYTGKPIRLLQVNKERVKEGLDSLGNRAFVETNRTSIHRQIEHIHLHK